MKRPLSGNTPDSLIRICPNSTDEDNNNPIYLQAAAAAMFDGIDEEELGEGQLGVVTEKKRRLSVDQVRALEKNFEVENKLEPDRKVKLAEELGLQPRQVAVWFQNRRARWKTKQLEKDYGVLKASYDDLKLSFDRLRQDNEALLKEIEELKSNLNEDTNTDQMGKCVKEEGPVAASDTEEDDDEDDDDQKPNLDVRETPISDINLEQHSLIFFASDSSDSSAILNEENGNSSNGHNSPGAVVSSSMGLPGFRVSSSSVYSGLVKMEEGQDLFGEEDQSCSGLMFAEDEAPCLNWCYSSDDQWDLNLTEPN